MAAVEAQLADACRADEAAREIVEEARIALADAEAQWSESLRSDRFDPTLQQALTGFVRSQEKGMLDAILRKSDAEIVLDREQDEWRELECRLRSGDDLLQRGRQYLSRRKSEAREHEICQNTTWKWHKR